MLSTSKHQQFYLLQILSNKRKENMANNKKNRTQKTTYKDTLNSILATETEKMLNSTQSHLDTLGIDTERNIIRHSDDG